MMDPVETETVLARARVLAEGGNRVDLDVDLEAGEGGVLSRFLIKGWSKAEPWGCWTEGREASFHVLIDYPYKSDVIANFKVHGYVNEKTQGQHITVLANKKNPTRWSLISEKPVTKTLYIPAEGNPFGNFRAAIEFMFIIHSPGSPHVTGISADQRLLGLGLRSVRFSLAKAATLDQQDSQRRPRRDR
jgi:hypothetical protein